MNLCLDMGNSIDFMMGRTSAMKRGFMRAACHVDDGTAFYFELGQKDRLFVLWQGKEVVADLPCREIEETYPFENSVYFLSNRKVYQSSFTPPDRLSVVHIRDLDPSEELHDINCSIVRDGKKYVYRMWQDRVKDGILIDVPDDEIEGLKKALVHRGKLIFLETLEDGHQPFAYQMSENIIVAQILPPNSRSQFIARDSSSFIYVAIAPHLHTLNTATMEILPTLRFREMEHQIVLVRIVNGMLLSWSGDKEDGSDMALKLAQLPNEYFEESNANSIEWAELNERITELELSSIIREEHIEPMFESKFLSEFSIEQCVGSGSFGCVFKATNLLDDYSYAVKAIALKPSAKLIDSTLGEVRKMAKLHHPGIVRYHSTWIEEPPEGFEYQFEQGIEGREQFMPNNNSAAKSAFIFIQMEFCEESLADWLNQERSSVGPRNELQIKSWFKQIIKALEYMHSNGIFHRDLKPGNILVVSDEVVKICDLGIATESAIDSADDWRTDIGTPMYKAPEQNLIYDRRVDFFSAGLILLEMCVAMSLTQTIEAFNDIRSGRQLSVLHEEPDALNLIMSLTKLNRDERPGIYEILNHPYFSELLIVL